MADVTITIKLTAQEFDLVRTACERIRDEELATANDSENDARIRHTARAQSMLYTDLIARMQ